MCWTKIAFNDRSAKLKKYSIFNLAHTHKYWIVHNGRQWTIPSQNMNISLYFFLFLSIFEWNKITVKIVFYQLVVLLLLLSSTTDFCHLSTSQKSATTSTLYTTTSIDHNYNHYCSEWNVTKNPYISTKMRKVRDLLLLLMMESYPTLKSIRLIG